MNKNDFFLMKIVQVKKWQNNTFHVEKQQFLKSKIFQKNHDIVRAFFQNAQLVRFRFFMTYNFLIAFGRKKIQGIIFLTSFKLS